MIGAAHPGCSKRLGLADRADNLPAQLSGGQQKWVAIDRGLITDRLLLDDEPLGARDVYTGRRVLQLLQEANRSGLGVVMVTLNRSAAAVADRVIHMRDGAIVEELCPCSPGGPRIRYGERATFATGGFGIFGGVPARHVESTSDLRILSYQGCCRSGDDGAGDGNRTRVASLED